VLQWIEQLQSAQWCKAEMPMPPSVNNYWKKHKLGVYLSPEAKRYRQEVALAVRMQRVPEFLGPVIAILELHPNKQRCDLDNYEKGFWDALQLAGVLYNDCQVSCVLRYWGEPRAERGITLSLAAISDPIVVAGLPGWSDQHGGNDASKKRKPRSCKKPTGGSANAAKPTSRQPRVLRSTIRRIGAEVDD
jgi:crossover junction endodeoxyribonuclease RusA